MKAVEFYWHGVRWASCAPPFWGRQDKAEMESFLVSVVRLGRPLSIRYDNGQLCTFRRKTKGQNNEQ